MSIPSALKLVGATNFRDFGGYPTLSGQQVVRGKLFRSNQFARLTDEDHKTLTALNVVSVVDLRSEKERAAQPTALKLGKVPDYISSRPDTDFIFTDIFADTAQTESAWIEAFINFYAALPELYADELRLTLELIANGEVPLIIHCSAGKDRTGVAAAIILDLLDVDRSLIVTDYLESHSRLSDDRHFKNMFSEAKLERYAQLPDECRNVMLGTRPEFVAGALASLEKNYGSTVAYVQSRLGLSGADIKNVRANLLV